MKSQRLISIPSLINEDNETEPPGKSIPEAGISQKKSNFQNRQNNFSVSPRALKFMNTHFNGATVQEWNDWKWQLRNSFTSLRQASRFLDLSEDEMMSVLGKQNLPLRITPYYASLLDKRDANHPLRRTMIPVQNELIITPEEKADPLGEENQSPLPQLVHRYPDRVLFLTTGFCSSYCRYCTRSHMVSKKEKEHSGIPEWDAAIEYIRNHPEVRDVLLSGGDPLTLSDSRLSYLLGKLRKIPHVEIIRIGTKVPVVLPQRITPELLSMLKKHHPLFMSIHFTHPEELTPETSRACNMIADAGIPMGSQTVLLKGVNDHVETFKKLMQGLLKMRVRPYYLYQCDPIPGSSHFRTKVSKGLELIKGLRGFTSGYAIPHFVVDAPGGGGKIPLLPEYVAGKDDEGYLLVNYQGKFFRYPESEE